MLSPEGRRPQKQPLQMRTPEGKRQQLQQPQMGTSDSGTEDSPVYRFISNLSPIKPVKCAHIGQTFHPESFSSIPSVFTSPREKVPKEDTFLKRCRLSDRSKPDIPGDEINLRMGVSNAVKRSDCAVYAQENCNVRCLLGEMTKDAPEECSTLLIKQPYTLQYDFDTPNHNTMDFYGVKPDCKSIMGGTSLDPFVHGCQEEGRTVSDGTHSLEQTEDEVLGCNWGNLIHVDVEELIICSSTEPEACEGLEKKFGNQDATSLTSQPSNIPEDNKNDCLQKARLDSCLGPCLQNAIEEPPLDCIGEAGDQNNAYYTPHILSACQNMPEMSDQKRNEEAGDCMPLGCKVDSRQQRGMRRRCLDFEGYQKNLRNDSSSISSASLTHQDVVASDNTHQTSSKLLSRESPFLRHGLGLHLNALSTTSNVRVEHDMASGGCLSSTTVPNRLTSVTVGPKTPNNDLAIVPFGKGSSSTSADVQALQVMQDSFQAPPDRNDDELNHRSPKKKKRKSENGGETVACRGCNCKRSKCLKLYCECFAAGLFCSGSCSCEGCCNNELNQEEVLSVRRQIESRCPLAFAPKVIRASDSAGEMGEDAKNTPASARHKRGCNCKKSSCLKKYCECFQGGVGCSVNCRCDGCKNAFGRKDGKPPGTDETEHEAVDTIGIGEQLNDGQQKAEVHKDEQQFSENVTPFTPFAASRSSAKRSFFSNGKPPRSSVLTIGSSPLFKTSQTLGRPELTSLTKFGRHFQTDPEAETPEILQYHATPISAVKNVSPNRKRVSSPHHGIGASPNHKGARRLILKSIPSLPPFTGDAAEEQPDNNPPSSSNQSPLR